MDNQIYGLTKGQLSPTSAAGRRTASSPFGALEAPVNPLLYVLAYGAGFVAQGTPADMAGLAAVIEAGIRHPGFAFVNVQSPCVTFGDADWQLRQHKAALETLDSLGHDPADRLKAMALAQEYGTRLYTGVFYRDPDPPPTFEDGARERHEALRASAPPRHHILDAFLPRGDEGGLETAPS
jgi:2-oxoglutarate ferredoxin oxidoreductase subunit beta